MHICHCMFYQFQLGNNARSAACHIYAALGKSAVADCTCPDWFKRLAEGDTSLGDRPRSERPLQSSIERTKVLIEDSPPLTTRALSAMLGYNQFTINRHFHDIGKANKLVRWLPHPQT